MLRHKLFSALALGASLNAAHALGETGTPAPVQPVMRQWEHTFCAGSSTIAAKGLISSSPLPLEDGPAVREELNRTDEELRELVRNVYAMRNAPDMDQSVEAAAAIGQHFSRLSNRVSVRLGRPVNVGFQLDPFERAGPCLTTRRIVPA